ncbi:MAG: SPFH domain-containing protein [Defluviitaleaceae bacterium]|nr:SPFH domain-containing protein [Defluviitaleaceae bacterium]MCL2239900.1 SPFH domain-containing protein [Defluviitaleaceae bacterium]
MKVKGAIVAVIALLVLSLIILVPSFISSVNIIEDGTVGVVRRFGRITETITPGGWNIRWSWWHTVDTYDIRTREANIDFNAYSIDAQNVRGQVSIQYRINPASVQLIAREFGTLEQLESMIHAMFNNQILHTIASRTATYLIESIYLVSGEIWDNIMPHKDSFHITLHNVALEGLQFSDAFRMAVDQRIVAREHQEQTRIEVETERLRAELALEVARLEGEAVVVAAEADARSIQVMLEVWDDLTSDIREIMLRQLAIEVWDGALPRVVVSSGEGESEFSLFLDIFSEY